MYFISTRTFLRGTAVKIAIVLFLSKAGFANSSNLLCESILRLARSVEDVGPRVVEIDGESAMRWVDAHPTEFQESAKQLLNLISFVSYREFTHTLDQQLLDYSQRMDDETPGMILILSFYDEMQSRGPELKSGHWLTGRAIEKFPVLKKFRVYPTQYIRDVESALQEGTERILIIDDMSITGDQLVANLRKFSYFSSPQRKKPRDLTFIIPYTMPDARNRMYRILSDKKGITLSWPGTENILSASRIFYDKENSSLDKKYIAALIDSEIIWKSSYDFSAGLSIFEHKLPDHESFPLWIVEGKVPGRSEKFPFIVWKDPVYKAAYP